MAQKKARFRVGQRVVVHGAMTGNGRRFTIGFVYEGKGDDGKPFFWYTRHKTDKPPYYTESILRLEAGRGK